MARLLTDRYQDRLAGVMSCYDRIVITGTLPGACFGEGMTKILQGARHPGLQLYHAVCRTMESRPDLVAVDAGEFARYDLR
jgi:hypothetical protein